MAEVKISADSGGGSVALKGPATTTGNAAVSLKLPVADGSANQLLKTDGSGNLGWATDQGGKILGMNSVSYDDQQRTFDSTSWADTGMEVTYTPTASNSTALITLFSQIYSPSSQYIYLQLRQADAVFGATDVEDGYLVKALGNTAAWADASITFHVSPTWTAGTQTSFQIYARKHTSSQGATYLGWGAGGTKGTYKDGLIIQEVAA